MATEICYLALKPGKDIDSSTVEAKTWHNALKIISEQDGYQGQYWGRQLEHPEVVMLFIDWENLEKHEKFQASPAYAPMTSSLTFMSDVHFHHAIFQPHPPGILAISPCIEFVTFYDVREGFMSNARKFGQVMREGSVKGFFGTVAGEVVEDLKREGKEVEDNGKALVLLIAWESKEAHLAFRDTDLFKKNIEMLRVKNGGVVMSHVQFKAFEL